MEDVFLRLTVLIVTPSSPFLSISPAPALFLSSTRLR